MLMRDSRFDGFGVAARFPHERVPLAEVDRIIDLSLLEFVFHAHQPFSSSTEGEAKSGQSTVRTVVMISEKQNYGEETNS